jgi:hypothetical protein
MFADADEALYAGQARRARPRHALRRDRLDRGCGLARLLLLLLVGPVPVL